MHSFSLLVLVLCFLTSRSYVGNVNLFGPQLLNVTVFNAFGNQNVFAQITFGKELKGKMTQISYGSYKSAPLNVHSADYVVQFTKLPTGDTVEEYTTYGHLGYLETNVKEILVIIMPSLQDKPEARIITFRNHSDGFNRLYFFNAMLNKVHPDKGVFIYGLYNRPNYDGSKSKSINQYANDLPFGEGRESTLFPGTTLTIKAFHQSVNGVPEFDRGPMPLCPSIQVVGEGNTQSYIILFGSFNNETEPPVIRALNIGVLSSCSKILCVSKNIMLLIALFLFLCSF